jgi:alpha,alpha-trehalase
MEALWVAACPHEASKFFTFLADATASQLQDGADLQIMFGIGGERDLSERELPHLAGGGTAARSGSATARGGSGSLTSTASCSAPLSGWSTSSANSARSPGSSWEIRGEPRDFLHSRLMCWVALDRAIALAGQLGAEDRVNGWAAARREIRAAIVERGWNERAGAFTQAFGSEDLDASALMLAIAGFLPGDDPRMKATIDAIAQRLTDQRGLLYRTGPLTGSPVRRGRSCYARSGWRRRRRWPARLRPPPPRSSVPWPPSTTSACWPRRSTRPSAG